MRCNRCGNPLDPRDTRCAVCGKVLVPLPPKKRPAPQRSGEQQNIKLPQLEKFTHTYNRDSARSHSFHTLTLLAAVAAVVLLVMVYSRVGALRTDMADLQQLTDSRLSALQQQDTPVAPPVEESTEAPTEMPTEAPVDTPAKPLGQQKMTADVTLFRHSDGIYTAASLEQGTADEEATCWVVTTKHKAHIQWTFGESGNRLELVISDGFDEATSELMLKVNWNSSGEILRSLSVKSCVWECRSAGSEWGAIPAEYLTVEEGSSKMNLTTDAVGLLLAQYDEMEVRCQVVLEHPDGGSVTMTADGMTVTRSGLVTFANKPG